MSVASKALASGLDALFISMNSMTEGGNSYFATNAATLIQTYISTGTVTTVDAGACPAGAYAGSSSCKMSIDGSSLGSKFTSTFNSMDEKDASGNPKTDDTLAENMAKDMIDIFTASNIIAGTSTGTATSGTTVTTYSGSSKGSLSGTDTLTDGLKNCFKKMSKMEASEDINLYFASTFASAIENYLTAGAVAVTLQSPFTSGSGTGSITFV